MFVVPKPMYGNYKLQKISKDPIFCDMKLADVLAADCAMVKGIKTEKKRKLNDAGITNIGQLINARDAPETRFVRSAISQFEEKLKMIGDAAAVEEIDKFVIGIDYTDKESA